MRRQMPFPFFMPTDHRALTPAERAVLERLVEDVPEYFRSQPAGNAL